MSCCRRTGSARSSPSLSGSPGRTNDRWGDTGFRPENIREPHGVDVHGRRAWEAMMTTIDDVRLPKPGDAGPNWPRDRPRPA